MSRRGAASAVVAVPVSPLDGYAIVVSGKFDSLNHTHASLEKLIKSLGGTVTKSVNKTTTHVVCTEDDFHGSSTRVAAGKAKGLPLISPEWILESEKRQQAISADSFAWHRFPSPSEYCPGKKRPIAVAQADGNAPETKKMETAPPAKRTRSNKAMSIKEEEVDEEEEPEVEPLEDAEDALEVPPKIEKLEDKKVTVGQFVKKKNTVIPVDEGCGLVTACYSVHIDPDSGMIYDASLNQTHASTNANKFYRIQILRSPDFRTFKTWTRWGRVGESGQNALLGNGTFLDAIKQFEKKFRDKSGLDWDNRADNPKPGKYAFVEKSYNPDDEDDDAEDDDEEKEANPEQPAQVPECRLEAPVKSLMELIFNQQYFQATMSALQYDADKLPLGKLSKGNILRGFQQLKELAALMDDPSLAVTRHGLSIPQATEQLSNLYYSIIPHAFGRNRPPIIRDRTLLKREIDLLESLSDMKEADELLRDLKKASLTHPLEARFDSLGLSEMTPLDRTTSEFRQLEDYLHGTRGHTHAVQYSVRDIFRVERRGEQDRLDDYLGASRIAAGRHLLWHGSRVANFGGILSQGLRIAPPEAPARGYMFGKGIYLADMSSKSARYCYPNLSGGEALLLLCEAKLGSPMHQLTQSDYNAGDNALKAGLESTWGMGAMGPMRWIDAGCVHPSMRGIYMPDLSINAQATGVAGATLYYNEYICYDVAQVRLRYLFRVKM